MTNELQDDTDRGDKKKVEESQPEEEEKSELEKALEDFPGYSW